MDKHNNLRDLLINADFQKMQDEISIATNVAMITVDNLGKPVTEHSCCSEFCRRIRSMEEFRTLCEKCDSRGGLEAARLQKPYLYLCHMGIVDFAIPIIINDVYLGAIMAGQILINDLDKDRLERIANEQSNKLLIDSDLNILYHKLPRMSLEKIIALSNIISYYTISLIKEILSNRSIQETVLSINENYYINNNKARNLIAPALSYIDKNYKSNITLHDVSEYCKISSSYLSRLFKKVVGCNFSHYVNIIRVSYAKKMLISTNISIAQLAIDLGYDDCGYFIKVFKRIERITPNEYRNKHSNRQEIMEDLHYKSLVQT